MTLNTAEGNIKQAGRERWKEDRTIWLNKKIFALENHIICCLLMSQQWLNIGGVGSISSYLSWASNISTEYNNVSLHFLLFCSPRSHLTQVPQAEIVLVQLNRMQLKQHHIGREHLYISDDLWPVSTVPSLAQSPVNDPQTMHHGYWLLFCPCMAVYNPHYLKDNELQEKWVCPFLR